MRELSVQEVEMQRLRNAIDYYKRSRNDAQRRSGANLALAYQHKAESDIARAALEKIANGDGVYGTQAHEYKQIARQALADIDGDTDYRRDPANQPENIR